MQGPAISQATVTTAEPRRAPTPGSPPPYVPKVPHTPLPSLYPRADPHATANLAQRDPRRLERCGPSARPAPARHRPRLAARRRGGTAQRGGRCCACAAGGGCAVSAVCGTAPGSAVGGDHPGGRRPGPSAAAGASRWACPTHTNASRHARGIPVRRRTLCAASRASAAPGRMAGRAVPGGEAG